MAERKETPTDEDRAADETTRTPKQSLYAFCGKYFCEGQKVDKALQAKIDAGTLSWTEQYRKQLAMAVPFLLVHIVWWTAMVRWDAFHKFTDQIALQDRFRVWSPAKGKLVRTMHSGVRPWYMSATMVFGSMVAGATSEGGASIAFPVMTLAMDVKPNVAKQFSYMIQSVGMTAAAFVILYMQVQVDWKSITYCSIGGAFGVIYGLEQVAPTLTPPYAKMYFVCWAGSFAASLYFLNRLRGRKVYVVVDPKHLPEIWAMGDLTHSWQLNLLLNWKALILLVAGFVGGIFTSIAGSGIDICSFSVLTLLFRVSEKTATPTSVVLMAINTFLAMCYCKWMMREGLEQLAWEFFCVCAPIVVVGAPLGSVLGSYVHRLVLAAFVYATDFVQLVGALVVVRPWSREKCARGLAPAKEPTWGPKTCEPAHLCWSSALIFVCGLLAFYIFQWAGEKLIERNKVVEKEVAARDEKGGASA